MKYSEITILKPNPVANIKLNKTNSATGSSRFDASTGPVLNKKFSIATFSAVIGYDHRHKENRKSPLNFDFEISKIHFHLNECSFNRLLTEVDKFRTVMPVRCKDHCYIDCDETKHCPENKRIIWLFSMTFTSR